MDSYNNMSQFFTQTVIDFNSYIVLAVFDEPRSDLGYDIEITDVIENSTSIDVTVQKTYAGYGLAEAAQPFQIVKIPITTKPIVFSTVTIIY